MAIKITDSIQTDKGVTTDLYLNISSVNYDKNNGNILVIVKSYLNEAARVSNDRDICKTFIIDRSYSFDYSIEELVDNAYVIVYEKLNTLLISKGLTTVSV